MTADRLAHEVQAEPPQLIDKNLYNDEDEGITTKNK